MAAGRQSERARMLAELGRLINEAQADADKAEARVFDLRQILTRLTVTAAVAEMAAAKPARVRKVAAKPEPTL